MEEFTGEEIGQTRRAGHLPVWNRLRPAKCTTDTAVRQGGELVQPPSPRARGVAGRKLRVLAQPGFEMLFRPEELVVASTTTPKDEGLRWVHGGDPPVRELDVDAIHAVDARVEDLESFVR